MDFNKPDLGFQAFVERRNGSTSLLDGLLKEVEEEIRSSNMSKEELTVYFMTAFEKLIAYTQGCEELIRTLLLSSLPELPNI
jgi:hypothetical protein